MNEQEKRELNEFVGREILGWEDYGYDVEEEFTHLDAPYRMIYIMEQKIQEKGLGKLYIEELYCEVFSTKNYFIKLDVPSIFKLKTATPLQCCIAARKAWKNK